MTGELGVRKINPVAERRSYRETTMRDMWVGEGRNGKVVHGMGK